MLVKGAWDVIDSMELKSHVWAIKAQTPQAVISGGQGRLCTAPEITG